MTDTTDIKALRELLCHENKESDYHVGVTVTTLRLLLSKADQLEAERQRADAVCRDIRIQANDLKSAQTVNKVLQAELAALKGEQVPVGFIHHLDVAELKAGGDAEVLPHKTADWQIPVFTALQKPVVLPAHEDCQSCDRHYVDGMRAGWNFHEEGDNQGFIDSIERVQKDMREARNGRVKNDA